MTPRPAALVVPGDIHALTGGSIYDRRVLDELRAAGRDVLLVELGTSFPDPTPEDVSDAQARLAAIDPDRSLLVDGLALGALPPAALDRIRAPLAAMVHHPLAHEGGLAAARRDHLFRTERDNLARATQIVVPSPHTRALLCTEYGVPAARITVARPGLDRPSTARRPVDPPLILSVGIRVPRKGHDILMRALARIADRPWQAVIVGGMRDAEHAAELDALHSGLGLGDRVRLLDRTARGDLDTLFAKAAIFALATRYEGHGMVFDEAMAHGLPIVTCRAGAVPDTVPPHAGLLVPPGDPVAFAEAMARLLGDARLRRAMESASARAGTAIGSWRDTARCVGGVLDRMSMQGPPYG